MTTPRQAGRKRFPNWLRELVDKGEVSGVYWMDEARTIFRVPWTRVDSPEFDLAKDAMLFQRWAEFTGRYRVGERTDPSVWKTRFRCAIRKMTEIEEVKLANNLDDKSGRSQPFRAFRFKTEVQHTPKRKDTKRAKKRRTYQRTKYPKSSQCHNNKSHVTGQGIVRDVTKSVTQSWMNRGITAHGVTQVESFDGRVLPVSDNVGPVRLILSCIASGKPVRLLVYS
ncbi:hypothetical protein QZH41_007700 [Actinostola sp. cb2023]|nr:hypothetical protein QZH41_007700 [Actinostola sp. cb2023]